MNFIIAIISTILGIAIGLAAGFFLLIGLNGFSGSAGEYAVYTYIVWAILVALVAGVTSFLIGIYMSKTAVNKALIALLSILISIVVSVIGDAIGMLIAAVVADSLWKR